MKQKIGKRLKDLRLSTHMSQSKLAVLLGVQQTSVYRYEQGQAYPVPEVFVKYADLFDVSMDYLYCRTDNPQGKLYENKPKILTDTATENKEVRDFIEMCFDPKSSINPRLKQALYQLLTETKEDT